jgi:hypothetical protein
VLAGLSDTIDPDKKKFLKVREKPGRFLPGFLPGKK